MREYSTNDLRNASEKKVQSWALYSHSLRRVHLPDSPETTWICKEGTDPSRVRLEVLAQEFFRLIIEHQPETRLARHPKFNTYSILSEESIGYRTLPENEQFSFSDGTYTGLGQALAVAMFVQETDLKLGNIGLNGNDQVIKIDGDHCFGSILYPEFKYEMNQFSIEALPYPVDFFTFEWLDLSRQGINIARTSTVIDGWLSHHPQFRSEVNQALLKLCLLPDCFIEAFVDCYLPAGGERFTHLLKSQRDTVIALAAANDSLKSYIFSDDGQLTAEVILDRMKTMRSCDELIFPESQHEELESAFNTQKKRLPKPSMQKSSNSHAKPEAGRLEKAPSSSTPSATKPKKSLSYKAMRFWQRGCRLKTDLERRSQQEVPSAPNTNPYAMLKPARKITMQGGLKSDDEHILISLTNSNLGLK